MRKSLYLVKREAHIVKRETQKKIRESTQGHTSNGNARYASRNTTPTGGKRDALHEFRGTKDDTPESFDG